MYTVLTLLLIGVAGYALIRQNKKQKSQLKPGNRSSFEAFVSEQEFVDMVLETSKHTPVMVDFFAAWCNPCKAFAPVLSETVRAYGGAYLLAKVDVDANKKLAQQYNIQSMPTILIFKNEECVHRFTGAMQPHSLRYVLATNEIQKLEQAEKI